MRLFNVQIYLGINGGSFLIDGATSTYRFSDGKILSFKTFHALSRRIILPLAYLTQATGLRKQKEHVYNVLACANQNLSEGQKELLGWHYKLGHFNVSWIQRLTRPAQDGTLPIIPFKAKGVPACDVLHCAACRYSKATKLSVDTLTQKANLQKRDALKRENVRPGSMVSTDQFVSLAKGRLSTTAGKEREKECYSSGTFYVDEGSGMIHVINQVLLKAADTIAGKHSFERFACRVELI